MHACGIHETNAKENQSAGIFGFIPFKFRSGSKVPASCEFKDKLEEGVKSLVGKASQVKVSGRPWYESRYLVGSC